MNICDFLYNYINGGLGNQTRHIEKFIEVDGGSLVFKMNCFNKSGDYKYQVSTIVNTGNYSDDDEIYFVCVHEIDLMVKSIELFGNNEDYIE